MYFLSLALEVSVFTQFPCWTQEGTTEHSVALISHLLIYSFTHLLIYSFTVFSEILPELTS